MVALKFVASLGLLIAFALFASPSLSLPTNRLHKRSDNTSCIQATLGIGLRVFAQITSVQVTDPFGPFLKNQHTRNLTGEEILCNILPMENLLPDCWEKDLELLCFQKELERNLYALSDDPLIFPGGKLTKVQWIRNQLNHVPDSDAKDYICLNHVPHIPELSLGGQRCSELLGK